MSVFLLKSPDAVFIHIPKTAGRSIRIGAWEGRYEGPMRGHMPDAWRDHFKFAFSRHPIDRMLSAYRMFTEMRLHVPERRKSRMLGLFGIDKEVTVFRDHKPLFPGLDIAQFLAIAADESIGLDDRTPGTRKRKSTLRTHAIPQTHPHNMIEMADYVGRFEALEESMAAIGQRLGAKLSLPHTNRTHGDVDWRRHFDARLYDQAVAFYRADFERLGYDIEPFHR